MDQLAVLKIVVGCDFYALVPCVVLGILIHPTASSYAVVVRMAWGFCVYLESVSVLPQLRMVQKAKECLYKCALSRLYNHLLLISMCFLQMIEPFTAHYVFALDVARYLGCGHWILKVYNTGGRFLYLIGAGYFWLPMVLLAEVVQTFILADFCYYYVKSAMNGQLLVNLPLPV